MSQYWIPNICFDWSIRPNANNKDLWLVLGYRHSRIRICRVKVCSFTACTSSMIVGKYRYYLWVYFLNICIIKRTSAALMDAVFSALFSSEKEELYILDCLAYFMVLMAACCFVTLLFENVPYGRYSTSKYGFPVNAKVAWFIQELPAFLVPFSLVVWTSSVRTSLLPNQLLIAMYFCHYVQRWVFT